MAISEDEFEAMKERGDRVVGSILENAKKKLEGSGM